jgi:hypothetical protein
MLSRLASTFRLRGRRGSRLDCSTSGGSRRDWIGKPVNLPHFLRGWDVQPKIGLEFVYLDFQINNGHPPLKSGNLEVRGRWHDQELPIPTIGVEGRRWLCDNLLLEGTLQGNWINKWNSLRSQGGTVYLSQSSFETHWRLYYIDQHLMGLKTLSGLCLLLSTSRPRLRARSATSQGCRPLVPSSA